MSGKKTRELNYSGTKSSFRKKKLGIKKLTSKKRRRNGKNLLEDAPPRETEGWSD